MNEQIMTQSEYIEKSANILRLIYVDHAKCRRRKKIAKAKNAIAVMDLDMLRREEIQ